MNKNQFNYAQLMILECLQKIESLGGPNDNPD